MRSNLGLFNILVFIFVLSVISPCFAQQRSDTGRHKTVSSVVNEEKEITNKKEDNGKWSIEINGGMLAGSDLFRAYHTTGDTIAWVPESTGDWVSQKIRVSLENSVGFGFQVQRRMSKWYSLSAGVSFTQMDINAQAPIIEITEIFPYDQADMWIFSGGVEVRLTSLTESFPYFKGDLLFVDFSPVRNQFLSQSNLGGRLGFGYHHQFDTIWAFNLEFGLSRSALSSIYFQTPEGADPDLIKYETENHLTLVEIKFGVRLKI